MDAHETNRPPVRMPGEDDLQTAQDIFRQTAVNIERHRKREAVICFQTASGEPLQDSEIKIVQETQDFLFGNLVFDLVGGEAPYRPELFKQRFQELFNFAIFPFYWPHYEPKPGMPRWQAMLPVLEWCLANGITPKGHPLVWPYSAGVPEWLYDMPEETVDELIQSRVLNIVKGFEPMIKIWDVTNEAVNHISWAEATQRSFHSRYHEIDLWRGIQVNGSFKREIPISEAADWVEKSLRWAYAANPEATLIVNDYNQEIDLNVRQRFFDLIQELQARGAPVSGIGLQVHPVNHWIWPQELWETLEMYAALELPIHITELHQPSWGQEIEGGWKQGTWTEDAQAEFMSQLYQLCFGHPSVVSINHWGLSDRNIWIPGGGLVDAEYRPKPVFNMLKQLIKQEWMTSPLSVSTGKDGLVSFYGFLGQYKLTLQQSGRQHAAYAIHVAENEKNNWVFRVG